MAAAINQMKLTRSLPCGDDSVSYIDAIGKVDGAKCIIGLHENISVYSVLSVPSSPCSRCPNFSPPGGTVFCGSAVDSFEPDGGFVRSEHKVQPSRPTAVSISWASERISSVPKSPCAYLAPSVEKGSFTAIGTMEIARESHTATLLNSGNVLVVGGATLVPAFCGNNCSYLAPASLSQCELFNPATQTFTATRDLGTARFLHTATLLSDGSVLVTGGADSKVIGRQQVSTVLSTTELFQ